jgi:hypothetical protein
MRYRMPFHASYMPPHGASDRDRSEKKTVKNIASPRARSRSRRSGAA